MHAVWGSLSACSLRLGISPKVEDLGVRVNISPEDLGFRVNISPKVEDLKALGCADGRRMSRHVMRLYGVHIYAVQTGAA